MLRDKMFTKQVREIMWNNWPPPVIARLLLWHILNLRHLATSVNIEITLQRAKDVRAIRQIT